MKLCRLGHVECQQVTLGLPSCESRDLEPSLQLNYNARTSKFVTGAFAKNPFKLRV